MTARASTADVFAQVFESSGAILCVLDATHRIVECNARATAALFPVGGQAQGRDFVETCVYRPDRSRVLQFLATAMGGRSVQNVTVWVRRELVDRSVGDLETLAVLSGSFTPLRGSSDLIEGVVFSAQDFPTPFFSDRRASLAPEGSVASRPMPQQLEVEGMLIQQAVAAIASCRVVMDASGSPVDVVILDANPAFEVLTELRLAVIRGRHLTEIEPRARESALIDICGRVVATGEPVTYAHESAVTGRRYLVSIYRAADLCFFAVCSDITPPRPTPAVAPGPLPFSQHPSLDSRPSLPGAADRFGRIDPRVLLAEDDVTNQQVAVLILRKLGLAVDVVATGRHVLSALRSRHYDVVLMNVQMPDMDGLEATRAIRAGRGEGIDSEIPIIALTAQDTEEGRGQCIAAGMNDYIAKPVRAETLSTVLEKWWKTVPTPVGPRQDPAVERCSFPPVFNRADLMERIMDDLELARDVTNGFIEDMPQQLRALRARVGARDAIGAGRLAHAIKGAAAAVGGERMAALALVLEKAGGAGYVDTIARNLERLEGEFDALREAIRESLGHLDGKSHCR